MAIPLLAAVIGGAAVEAATGVLKKTFKKASGKKSSAAKPKKAGAKKSVAKRKPAAKKTAKKTVSKSSGINKVTGRLKKGYKYSNGRVVKAKKTK